MQLLGGDSLYVFWFQKQFTPLSESVGLSLAVVRHLVTIRGTASSPPGEAAQCNQDRQPPPTCPRSWPRWSGGRRSAVSARAAARSEDIFRRTPPVNICMQN